VRPTDPDRVRARFLALVASGFERADREERERMARIRALPKPAPEEERDALGAVRRKRGRPVGRL
jgi:hypothetical protein